MPWIRTVRPFSWKPKPMVTIDYKGERVYLVTRRCADFAVQTGHAVKSQKPKAKPG
jgi:hypothetical protein